MDAIIRTSKFLSKILRHKPQSIGLQLDAQGWAEVEELIQCAGKRGMRLSYQQIRDAVAQNDKQRFTLKDGRIRANQGHSIEVDLGLEAVPAPDVLFHGTATRFLKSILNQGLHPGNRQHVHLSRDKETASRVGTRHGKLAMLKVDTKRMETDGYSFYVSANGVWLTDEVPARYLTQVQD